jgi:hypothetical protein
MSATKHSRVELRCRGGGRADVKTKLLSDYQAGSKTFRVHLDGYNQLPTLPAGSRAVRASSSFTSTTTAIW